MTDTTRLLYDIPESRAALGNIGNSKFYEIVSAGDIQLVKIGQRSFVEPDELERYVISLREKAAEKAA